MLRNEDDKQLASALLIQPLQARMDEACHTSNTLPCRSRGSLVAHSAGAAFVAVLLCFSAAATSTWQCNRRDRFVRANDRMPIHINATRPCDA